MIHTPLCDLLGIKHPVMLAGMNSVSTSELVAAVSNAGGIGTLGGFLMSPSALRQEIKLLKEELIEGMPFGVDLAFPKVGDGARKTNYDYTGGNLEELIDVTIEGGARIFVCAIGVPPPTVVTKLHDNDIIVMNMIGAPHHVEYALKAGVDVVIAQGSEGGGHTGDIGTMALIPEVVDLCRGRKNFWGNPVQVVAAGGVTDGRGLAAALALGATGVWVGTRFVASEESAAPKAQKNKIIRARASDTVRTCVFTGRPCRILPTKLVKEWEAKPEKMRKLLDEGIIPIKYSLENETATGKDVFELFNSLSGQGCGVINDVKPAAEIVSSMVREASEVLHEGTRFCKL